MPQFSSTPGLGHVRRVKPATFPTLREDSACVGPWGTRLCEPFRLERCYGLPMSVGGAALCLRLLSASLSGLGGSLNNSAGGSGFKWHQPVSVAHTPALRWVELNVRACRCGGRTSTRLPGGAFYPPPSDNRRRCDGWGTTRRPGGGPSAILTPLSPPSATTLRTVQAGSLPDSSRWQVRRKRAPPPDRVAPSTSTLEGSHMAVSRP